MFLLSRPTIPTHASYPTSASSCSSACAIPHNDNSAFSPYDGKVVMTDLSVGQANISNAQQLSFFNFVDMYVEVIMAH